MTAFVPRDAQRIPPVRYGRTSTPFQKTPGR
jgi:hypothetical protein